MTPKLDALLSKLSKVKSVGPGKWMACCPAHNDKSPSFAIKLTDDNKILLHCFAGCSVPNVLDAIKMDMSDLHPDTVDYQKSVKPPRFNKYELFDRLVFEATTLSIGIRQLLDGNGINEKDLQRIMLAESTIDDIARECRSPISH